MQSTSHTHSHNALSVLTQPPFDCKVRITKRRIAIERKEGANTDHTGIHIVNNICRLPREHKQRTRHRITSYFQTAQRDHSVSSSAHNLQAAALHSRCQSLQTGPRCTQTQCSCPDIQSSGSHSLRTHSDSLHHSRRTDSLYCSRFL